MLRHGTGFGAWSGGNRVTHGLRFRNSPSRLGGCCETCSELGRCSYPSRRLFEALTDHYSSHAEVEAHDIHGSPVVGIAEGQQGLVITASRLETMSCQRGRALVNDCLMRPAGWLKLDLWSWAFDFARSS